MYSAQGSDVVMTMVHGKVLYHNGEFTTMDAKLVVERARKEAALLLERAEKVKNA